MLRGYEHSQGIARFDMAIDWGWFWFLTQPFFWLLDIFLQAARQFRPRHPAADRDGEAALLPARQRPVQVHEQDEEGAAGDGAHQEALQGRSAEAAAGDDGAVQAREGESALRLPADAAASFRCSSRSTRCSTSPSRCGRRRSMAGSTICRRPIPPRSSICSGCSRITCPICGPLALPLHRHLADPDGHHPVSCRPS